jgi:hypothetical protein
MKPLRLKVGNPELSEVAQKVLFALGHEWFFKGKKVSYTEAPFLVTDAQGYIWSMDYADEPSFMTEEGEIIDLFNKEESK